MRETRPVDHVKHAARYNGAETKDAVRITTFFSRSGVAAFRPQDASAPSA